ncbi:hypothetical protein K1719_028546 [Acacia pycnantha]|nr:hypothetical protein K1719_028546 [Acacia pycnantha]
MMRHLEVMKSLGDNKQTNKTRHAARNCEAAATSELECIGHRSRVISDPGERNAYHVLPVICRSSNTSTRYGSLSPGSDLPGNAFPSPDLPSSKSIIISTHAPFDL